MNRIIQRGMVYLFLLLPCMAHAMQPPKKQLTQQEEAELDRDLLQAARELAEMKRERVDPQREMRIEQARDARLEKQEYELAIKNQNTLLTPQNWYVGLYKRDFVEGAHFAGDLMADVLMYKNLAKRRVLAIEAHIKEHLDEIIDLLELVTKAQEEARTKFEDMKKEGKPVTQSLALVLDRELTPLRKYLAKNYAVVGFNPFNSETIVPLCLRLLWSKVSNACVDSFIVDDAPNMHGWRAYKKNANGEYEVCQRILKDRQGNPRLDDRGNECTRTQTPLSIVTLLNFCIDPKKMIWRGIDRYLARQLNGLSDVQTSIGSMGYRLLGIPEWLSRPEVKIAGEIAALGFATQVFDQTNNYHWNIYVVKHREKLLEILKEYKKVLNTFGKQDEMGQSKETHVNSIAYWEGKIRSFVVKGHTPDSWMPMHN